MPPFPSVASGPANLVRWLSIAGAAAVLALACAPSAHASSNCRSPESRSLAAPEPSACWLPFSATSPFNTELPSNPKLASDNAAVRRHIATYHWAFDATPGGYTMGGSADRPVYFAKPSDPLVTIHCANEFGPGSCTGTNGINIDGAQIHVPAGAVPDGNSDAHMTIVETDTGSEYDMWHASRSGSAITTGTGAEINVDDTDGLGSGGDAADFALTGGLLRPSELAAGRISHALVIVVPCTNATGNNVGFTWPAIGGFGDNCQTFRNQSSQGAPELGQLVRLNMTDAQIAKSGAPAWQQTIMTALAHYGAYIEDTNGPHDPTGIQVVSQSSLSWTSIGQPDAWAALTRQYGENGNVLGSNVPIPASKLEVVDTCVTHGTCPNASGPTAVEAGKHPAKRAGHQARK